MARLSRGRSRAVPVDKRIDLPIVTEVRKGHPHAPAKTRKTRLFSDVLEGAVRFLMVKSDHGIAAGAVALDRRSIDDNNVLAAVPITIEQTNTAAHGFEDEALLAREDVLHS